MAAGDGFNYGSSWLLVVLLVEIRDCGPYGGEVVSEKTVVDEEVGVGLEKAPVPVERGVLGRSSTGKAQQRQVKEAGALEPCMSGPPTKTSWIMV